MPSADPGTKVLIDPAPLAGFETIYLEPDGEKRAICWSACSIGDLQQLRNQAFRRLGDPSCRRKEATRAVHRHHPPFRTVRTAPATCILPPPGCRAEKRGRPADPEVCPDFLPASGISFKRLMADVSLGLPGQAGGDLLPLLAMLAGRWLSPAISLLVPATSLRRPYCCSVAVAMAAQLCWILHQRRHRLRVSVTGPRRRALLQQVPLPRYPRSPGLLLDAGNGLGLISMVVRWRLAMSQQTVPASEGTTLPWAAPC